MMFYKLDKMIQSNMNILRNDYGVLNSHILIVYGTSMENNPMAEILYNRQAELDLNGYTLFCDVFQRNENQMNRAAQILLDIADRIIPTQSQQSYRAPITAHTPTTFCTIYIRNNSTCTILKLGTREFTDGILSGYIRFSLGEHNNSQPVNLYFVSNESTNIENNKNAWKKLIEMIKKRNLFKLNILLLKILYYFLFIRQHFSRHVYFYAFL